MPEMIPCGNYFQWDNKVFMGKKPLTRITMEPITNSQLGYGSQKGFSQSVDLGVICRFKLEDILVDVMSTTAIGWAPANPWFANGFDLREKVAIDDLKIQIMPIPYFIASKFSAFKDRGGLDPRMS